MKNESRLYNMPISFFAMIMGLGGLTIASQKIIHILALQNCYLDNVLLILTASVFAILALFYSVKFLKYRDSVKADFNHPIKLNFFPTISISMLLLAIACLNCNMGVSRFFWILGSSVHLIFTLTIFSIWIQQNKFDIKHMNPAWFIPAVGNILVPVAGVKLGYTEISWFFFSIGLVFWIVLLSIFFYRIIFHNPIAEKLMPTLFILIAPPAVGFISYYQLVHEIDAFARVLYYFGFFIFLLLIAQFKLFNKIKFFLSWWAYSFPIAALTIASALMFETTQAYFYKYIAIGLFTFLSLLILVLVVRTIKAIMHKEICVPED